MKIPEMNSSLKPKKVRNITQGAVKLTPAVDAYSSNEAIENTVPDII